MCRTLFPAALLLLATLLAFGQSQQPPTPSPAQLRAEVQKVASAGAAWQRTVDAVKIDDLAVPYAIGKRYEEEKSVVTADLQLVSRSANGQLNRGGIYFEVEFLYSAAAKRTVPLRRPDERI